MITVFIILFVLTFSPAAVWAIREGGLRRLWLLCALALLGVLLLALLLSVVYSVASAWLVVLYLLAFVGPPILIVTGSLTLASGFARRAILVELITAFAGSMIGFAVGYVVVFYVLEVW